MRIKTQFPWVFLLVLTACSTQSARLPIAPSLSTPTIRVLSPSATAFATPTPSPKLPLTPTAIKPPALEDIKWSTYESSAGVSFEYPTDWLLIVHNPEYFVEFTFPYFPWNVSFYIFDRPLKDKSFTDPHNWNPNDGKEVLWERPISIENANGLEFIYGTPSDNQVSGLLIANYYSEKHALEVRFFSFADMIPTESDKFAIFEHVIQSVQIAP
jgi:hypothetical protein